MWWVFGLVMVTVSLLTLRWSILNRLNEIDIEEDRRAKERETYKLEWHALHQHPHRVWDAEDTFMVVLTMLFWPIIGLYIYALAFVCLLKWIFMRIMFPHGLKSKYAWEKERLTAAQELSERLQAEVELHEMLAAEHNLPSIGYVLERAEAEAMFLEQAAIVAQMASSVPWTGTGTRD